MSQEDDATQPFDADEDVDFDATQAWEGPEAEPLPALSLRLIDGDARWDLPPGSNRTIGRTPSAEDGRNPEDWIMFNDKFISRKHARVTRDEIAGERGPRPHLAGWFGYKFILKLKVDLIPKFNTGPANLGIYLLLHFGCHSALKFNTCSF